MAELKLKVSLDTSYLKGQISRLPLEFAGANVSIRPKFDRQAIVNEFRLLNRYIGSKKFNIVINTNLSKEIENADRLVKALGRVQQAASGAKGGLPIGTKQLSLTGQKGGFTAAEIKTLFSAAIQGGLLDEKTLGKKRDQMVAALGSIGRDSIAGLLNGLKSGDADIQKAARLLGGNLITSLKTVLGIASPSREFKKIGEAAGQGFEQGLSSSMADAFDSLERQLGTRLQRLKGQAIVGTSGALAVSGRVSPVQVADVTPRDHARIAGSGSRAALPPGVDRSAATAQEFLTVMDRIGLAMANFTDTVEATTATMQGLRKVIAALNNRALLSGHEQYRLFAQSLTKGQLPLLAGATSQQLPMLKAAGAAPRADALRPQERLLRDFLARTTKLLLPQGPGASGGRSVFSGEQFRQIAGSLRRPQIGPGTDLTVKSVAIKDLTGISGSIKQLLAPLLPPKGGTTAGAREISQMRQQLSALPPLRAPAIGNTRGPLSPAASREAAMAMREREARARSTAREASILAEDASTAVSRKLLPAIAQGRQALQRLDALRTVSGQVPLGGLPAGIRGFLPPAGGIGGGGGPVPPTGGGGGGGGGSFGGMQFNVPQLPGAGLVREIGTEFGFAAKQVLLFGTAYKALAFIQGFPAQVGAAVGALQSFRNTLKAISPTAEEAAASSQFILDVVDEYNVPIQSARDGFTRLYASMKPTGFSGDEIRDLFLGISQAAATFGMSADKVDRVNYAFAQMASKGQVMSEELKQQLGDVLPGAMGIFAKAAGFEGPDAITKFSKAMEDGAYKGTAMKTLLTNVGSIMREEFGPGAEGAARTFQGVMNRMQNSTKSLYEAFEPVAVGFLNSVVMPLTSGLKTVTDGFDAFFTGVNAKTAGGFAFAQELEKLRPTFEGIRANVAALMPTLQSFASTLLGVSQVFLQIAGNPFIGYLGRVYLNVLALTTAINVLNLRALIPMIANFIRSAYSLIVFTAQVIRASIATGNFGMAARTAGLMLRTFFASTGVGIVLIGIGLLIERFMSMNQALADTKAKALGAAQAIRAMSQTEARQAANQAATDVKLLQGVSQREQVAGNKGRIVVSPQEKAALERAGVGTQTTATRERGPEGFRQTVGITQLRGAIEARHGMQREAEFRQRQIKFDEAQTQQPVEIAPITPGGGDGSASASKAAKELDTYNRSTLDFIKLRLEAEKQSLDQRRQAGLLSETGHKIAVAELELESSQEEVAERLRLSRLAISRDNLSAADKALKLKDTEIIAERELSIAADKRNIAVAGATKELEGPFNDAIYSANFAMIEQQMLLENLKGGIEGLAPEQQAYLQVLGLTKGKSEDELAILEKKGMEMRDAIERQIALNREVERGKILLGLSNQLTLARTLDPGLELREQIRQRNPNETLDRIEQEALLQEQVNAAQKTKEQLQGIASAIGNSFGEAFKGIITGSMTVQQALAGMFQSIADSFADMAAQMIADFMRMQALGLLKTIFGAVAPALGGGIGSAFGASGPSFNAGAFSGPALSPGAAFGGAGAGNFSSAFGGGAAAFNPAAFSITGFANGGMVTGPTMGLVGEGRYNEAIIPLPDGKSVPVQLSGSSGGNAAPINTSIVVNVKNGQAESQMSGNQGNQLARELEGAVRQVILKESRPGGLISSSR